MPVLTEPALPEGSLRALPQPVLPADRVVLRPWRHADAPSVTAAFACPDIQRWHVRRIDSADEAHAWIDSWPLRWHAESDASWAVVDGDDRVLGQVGLRTVDLLEGSARVSYWVLPESRGAGIATAAVHTMTAWVFHDLRLHRLYLDHSTANHASCRVATKAGFAAEGTLRGAGLHTDGWHDMHLHSRLRTD